jgi:hypothetical protein
MASLSYLVGTWNCTYDAGSQKVTFTATYAYAMDNNWMRERDAWAGGGGEEGLLTYDLKAGEWTMVVMENDRTTTIFRGKGNADGTHIAYRGVYPNNAFAEDFDRISAMK